MDPTSIASMLQREIESGALAPGTVLKQESIAVQFRVSRQPVRQALNQLLGNGLVVRRSDRSLAVTAFSPQEAAELSELRAIVEVAALERSAPKLAPSAWRKAARLNADLAEEEDPAQIEALDMEFHQTLYRGCENARLLATIDVLRRESRRAYRLQPIGNRARADLFEEHENILDAGARGDVDVATRLLRHHLIETTAKLISSSN